MTAGDPPADTSPVANPLFLRFAQKVLVPLAVGVLISYALEPIVSWLKKWSIPRAVGAGVLLAALVGGAGEPPSGSS